MKIDEGPILLLEDDKDSQELLEEAFSHLHLPHPLIFFDNGQAALNYLQTTPKQPVLILSDVNMPRMNGLQLRRVIDENQILKEKSIPFIFLTTSASEQNIREAYQMSVQGFFQKPHKLKELEALLRLIYEYWQRCCHPNK